MKILLLQPPISEKGVTSFMYPPLGLIALASYLQQEGHNISLYDSNVEKNSIEDILNLVKIQSPQIVGIGAMSVNINKTFEVAQAIKSYSKEIIIIVGGVHPTVEPQQTLENPYIDFVVRGEGEITAAELVNTLQKGGSDFEKIQGLGFKKENKIIINPPRDLIKDISALPIPAYHLLNIAKYRAPYTSRTPFMIMARSRGCPFQCTFCGVKKMFGLSYRAQRPERSIKEIEYLINELDIKEIGFKDSEFTLDPKNVEELCDLLIEKKYDLTWDCNGRVNHVTPSLLKKMKEAGCTTITYGIESGDQKVLDIMKKQITIQQIIDTIKMSKAAKLKVIGNFMIGNAGDTKETIEKTINFAKELSLDYAYFGFTTPFPGTELREQAIANGWLLNDKLEAIKYEDCIMNATSLPTPELKRYLTKAYRSFYFRPSYIAKRLLKLNKNEIYNSIRGALSIIREALKRKTQNEDSVN
jgi:anaerobic magnesium-protoporphyrin IX monomethyl ester cyclase